jgi:dihydroceramide fatty acyl 2-hydroxylase
MFFLAPRPRLLRPQRGSPRMFRVEWIEKYLSRVRPWHVVAVWGPVSLYCLARAALEPSPGLVSLALALAGLLFWTLLEYLLHRFLFHFPFGEDSELQRDLGFLIHGVHHGYPSDLDRLVMPPVVTALVAVLVGLPLWLLLAPRAFFPFFGAVVAGYLWYDLTHYALHHGKPRTRLGRQQQRYHLLHHFRTPARRYGVTTPLWDAVFGTLPPREEAP